MILSNDSVSCCAFAIAGLSEKNNCEVFSTWELEEHNEKFKLMIALIFRAGVKRGVERSY